LVGYSRLMGEDEAGTAKAVRERREAAAPIVREFGGRLVIKTSTKSVRSRRSRWSRQKIDMSADWLPHRLRGGGGREERRRELAGSLVKLDIYVKNRDPLQRDKKNARGIFVF
jgi:hypothetical protein